MARGKDGWGWVGVGKGEKIGTTVIVSTLKIKLKKIETKTNLYVIHN